MRFSSNREDSFAYENKQHAGDSVLTIGFFFFRVYKNSRPN